MILSFFYWNRMEQNKKKNSLIEKKSPIIVAPPSQQTINYVPHHQSKSPYQFDQERPAYQIKQTHQKLQAKVTLDEEDNQLNYLEIGNQNKKRQKSQTQRWTSDEYRKKRRNRSEQHYTVMPQKQNAYEKFNEFDNLDEISDDNANLSVKKLPYNRIMKKMTI